MAELKATFMLDKDGKPKYIPADKHRHYAIQLSVEGAPEQSIGVTYQLHESYYDPLREAYDASTGFLETITSYGDYDIVAMIRSKPRSIKIKSSLYEALKRTYSDTDNPDILRALNDIKENWT